MVTFPINKSLNRYIQKKVMLCNPEDSAVSFNLDVVAMETELFSFMEQIRAQFDSG